MLLLTGIVKYIVFVLHMQTAYQQLVDQRGEKKHDDHLIQNVMVR